MTVQHDATDPRPEGSWTRHVERKAFDVWNEVPLVPQLTGMSCWAAAAAMIVGWRDRIAVDPAEVAAGAGRWSEYQEGLLPSDLEHLARAWGLVIEPSAAWTVERLRERLESVGPLWMGEASPGLHSIVVTGIRGDGSIDGTHVRINDPWPVGRGERYALPIRRLMQSFRAATQAVGVHSQVLHAGGRGRGPAGRWSHDSSTTATVSKDASTTREELMDTYSTTFTQHGGFGRPLSFASSVVAAGQRYLASSALATDPLRGHGGTGENLLLRWNAVDTTAEAVDVLVHFHGYHDGPATRAMLERKVGISGADLSGRTRSTLVIVPRGRRISQAEIDRDRAGGGSPNPGRYTFDGLTAGTGQGLERLVAAALEWWGREILGRSAPAVDRLILSAHSGGGAPLNKLLRHHATRRVCNPHEAHVFDAIYGRPGQQGDGIVAWARARIQADRLAGGSGVRSDMSTAGGGLRILFGSGTRRGSEWIAAQLGTPDLLGGTARTLVPWYRVEYAGEDHNGIPRTLGPQLLVDVAANVVGAATSVHGLGGAAGYGAPLGLFRAVQAIAGGRPTQAWPAGPVHGDPRARALVDSNSPQSQQSEEVRRRIAHSIGQAEAGGRFDLVHDDSNRVNFGIGSWTGGRIADVLDSYVEVATANGTTATLYGYFGGQATFEALRTRFRTQGTAATASTTERDALRRLGADTSLQEAQIRRLARDVEDDLRVVGSDGNPWYPFIDGGMGAITEVAAHVLVHARHQAGSGGARTVLRRAIDHFGGDDALGRQMVAGTVTERDFLARVGEEVALRVQERYRDGVRRRYRRLLDGYSGSGLSYYFSPAN